MAQSFDICIRGAGVVGRTLALLLAQGGLRTALVDPQAAPAAPDVRAYALNAASRELLLSVRGWPDAEHATAVQRMEVFAGAGHQVQFDAAAQRCDALTWIVDVPALLARLGDALKFQPLVERVDAPVDAPLTIVCEGRASRTRSEFGVTFDVTPYAQHAIATRVQCEKPHGQVARQWFDQDGSILAFLPLDGARGNSVAVVWSVGQEDAQHWLDCDETMFTDRLSEISSGALCALRLSGPRARWPLQQAFARQWCGALPGQPQNAWVLAGDAAHNVHPLAGQGLNLGLADVQALAQVLRGRASWRSVGDLRLLRRYERARKAAVLPAQLAMDGLQQLFTRREQPLQNLRNWGMDCFERSPLLKAWVARQAMGQA